MLDGRADPDFDRSLVEGQVSASDLARDDSEIPIPPVLVRIGYAALAAVVVLGLVQLL